MKFVPALFASLLTTAILVPAAQANLLTNSSFEQTNLTNAVGYCYLGGACAEPGWSGNAVIIGAQSAPWGWPNQPGGYSYGNQLAGLQNGTYIQQVLSLAAGSYALDWADSGRLSYGGYQFFGAAQYRVLFNDQLLGSFTTQPGEAWALNHLSFTATGPGTLRFQGMDLRSDTTAFIDGLNLTANPVVVAVPEPASLALVALALAGVGVVRRRRQG